MLCVNGKWYRCVSAFLWGCTVSWWGPSLERCRGHGQVQVRLGQGPLKGGVENQSSRSAGDSQGVLEAGLLGQKLPFQVTRGSSQKLSLLCLGLQPPQKRIG